MSSYPSPHLKFIIFEILTCIMTFAFAIEMMSDDLDPVSKNCIRLEKINSTNHLPQFISTSKQNNRMNSPRFPIRIDVRICCFMKSS